LGELKKVLKVLGGGILAIVVMIVGGLWYLSWPVHKSSFKAEIVVDLVVDGERVNIRRIVKCSTVRFSYGHLTSRPPTVHAPTVGAIGKRLKSGGAIMMWTPYRCAHTESDDHFLIPDRTVIANDPDYIPFMGWTPNADTVDILELYPAAAYFKKPDARIKLLKLIVRNAPWGAWTDDPDEFEWFTGKTLHGERRPFGNSFSGLNALVLDEKDWKGKDRLLDALLARATSPLAITKEPVSEGIWASKRVERIFEGRFNLEESFIYPKPTIHEQVRYDTMIDTSILSPVRGKNALSNAFVLKRDETGAIEVSRSTETSFARLHRRGTIVSLGGVVRAIWKRGDKALAPNPKHASVFFYDPATKEIFWIFSVGYAGRARARK
jgi:hypothetical protein